MIRALLVKQRSLNVNGSRIEATISLQWKHEEWNILGTLYQENEEGIKRKWKRKFVDFSGEKDRQRANVYHEKAKELEKHGFLNFAQTLKKLAEDSEEDAKRSIKEGEDLRKKRELWIKKFEF